MSTHTIPEDAQRLADRLRMLADEVEAAARYGVPIPFMFSVSGHKLSDARFSATEAEFAAWTEYVEAEADTYYDRGGDRWSRASAVVNGLPLTFACRHAASAEVSV